jgi:hypothetical protein
MRLERLRRASKHLSGQLASRTRNKPWISKIQHRNVTYPNATPNRKTVRYQKNASTCKFKVEEKEKWKM